MSEDIKELRKQIEALQQEYDELDTGHSKLFKAYCALQERNGAMRQQLEIIKANIHEFPPEGMTIGKQIWIETTDKSLSSDAPTDYRNPAMEALKKAREAIKQLSLCDCNYNCEDCQHDNKLCSVYADGAVIDKALAAIAEVVGE